MKILDYWKIRRKYNSLAINYEILKKDCDTKSGTIAKLKKENKKLKKESKKMNRRIDELGRIVIPKELREELGINTGDLIKIENCNGKIQLEKQFPSEEVIDLEMERLKQLKEELKNGNSSRKD